MADPVSGPVVVTAVFTPRPGSRAAAVTALQRTIGGVHEEPGCLLYAIHDAPDGTIVMIEKWATVELLDAHGSGPAVAALRTSLDGLLAGDAVVTRLVPIPAGTPEQGLL